MVWGLLLIAISMPGFKAKVPRCVSGRKVQVKRLAHLPPATQARCSESVRTVSLCVRPQPFGMLRLTQTGYRHEILNGSALLRGRVLSG
jgi:hypothetical protein